MKLSSRVLYVMARLCVNVQELELEHCINVDDKFLKVCCVYIRAYAPTVMLSVTVV